MSIFHNIVFLCYNDFSCQSHCDYTLYCEIPADVEYTHHRIVPNPNIAKSMPVDETIWEIPCKSIKLSELKEDESEKNKTGTNVPQKDPDLYKWLNDAQAQNQKVVYISLGSIAKWE